MSDDLDERIAGLRRGMSKWIREIACADRTATRFLDDGRRAEGERRRELFRVAFEWMNVADDAAKFVERIRNRIKRLERRRK